VFTSTFIFYFVLDIRANSFFSQIFDIKNRRVRVKALRLLRGNLIPASGRLQPEPSSGFDPLSALNQRWVEVAFI
jgi:hypothetical protein